MLRVRDLTFTYPRRGAAALADVSLEVRAGECLGVTGPSGSGKSTLLRAVKGLLGGGALSGEVTAAADVGLVFQNAETQILCSTVAEEVAFGPENLCVPPPEIAARVDGALRDVALSRLRDRNVERLSAGQKHRLAIAAVLSMRPGVLLLDEPTSQLDAPAKADLVRVLAGLKRSGYAIVVVEHDLAALAQLVDRWMVLEGGRAGAASARPAPCSEPVARPTPRRAPPPGSAPAIAAEGVTCAYPGTGTVLERVDLRVLAGERVHLFGRNGCGKSTLLACLAGAVAPTAGTLHVAGVRVEEGARLFGLVGYLLQNPQRQLFEDTVHDEVAFSLRRLRCAPDAVRERVASALADCEAAHLADRLPLSLSFGEQHRVALASVLAPRPRVLLLDEPFAGLDLAQRRRLLEILGRVAERDGTAVLIASHDPLPDPRWPDRTVVLDGSRGAT